LLPSDGPCELRNLTWKVSSSLGFSSFNFFAPGSI
jgi:hypothetical protein